MRSDTTKETRDSCPSLPRDPSPQFPRRKVGLTRAAFSIRSVDGVAGHALDEELEDGDGVLLPEAGQDVKRVPAFRVQSLRVDLRFGQLKQFKSGFSQGAKLGRFMIDRCLNKRCKSKTNNKVTHEKILTMTFS